MSICIGSREITICIDYRDIFIYIENSNSVRKSVYVIDTSLNSITMATHTFKHFSIATFKK
jgi:hypothetical protein